MHFSSPVWKQMLCNRFLFPPLLPRGFLFVLWCVWAFHSLLLSANLWLCLTGLTLMWRSSAGTPRWWQRHSPESSITSQKRLNAQMEKSRISLDALPVSSLWGNTFVFLVLCCTGSPRRSADLQRTNGQSLNTPTLSKTVSAKILCWALHHLSSNLHPFSESYSHIRINQKQTQKCFLWVVIDL